MAKQENRSINQRGVELVNQSFKALGIKSIKQIFIFTGIIAVTSLLLFTVMALYQLDASRAKATIIGQTQVPALQASSAFTISHNEAFVIFQKQILNHNGSIQDAQILIEEKRSLINKNFKTNLKQLIIHTDSTDNALVVHLSDTIFGLSKKMLASYRIADSLILKGVSEAKISDAYFTCLSNYSNLNYQCEKLNSQLSSDSESASKSFVEKSGDYLTVTSVLSFLIIIFLLVAIYMIYVFLDIQLHSTVNKLNKVVSLEGKYKPIWLSEFKLLNESIEALEKWFETAEVSFKTIFNQKGNVQNSLFKLSDSDTLTPLIQEFQKKHGQEDKEAIVRDWVSKGVSNFVELLRNNNDLDILSKKVIKELVLYTGANQGAMFIKQEDEDGEEFLAMSAMYAYETHKYDDMRIRPGQGILGQVFLEKSTVSLDRIPEDYIKIRSGLGEASPKSLLIVPLMDKTEVLGVVELASFEEFEQSTIKFVENIGGNIGSTITSMIVNDRTRNLLRESQEQTEQLRAQEEEMRQNMEELTSTQEEMSRKEIELQKMYQSAKQNEEELKAQEEELRTNMEQTLMAKAEVDERNERINAILTASLDAIVTIDTKGLIETINKRTLEMFGYEEESELVGQKVNILMPPPDTDQHDDYLKNYQRTGVAQIIGKSREVKGVKKDGTIFYIQLSVSEIKFKGTTLYTGFLSNIDSEVKQRRELIEKNEMMLAVEEELRQNMEEMKTVNDQLVDKEKEQKILLEESLRNERELREKTENVNTMVEHTMKARKTAENQTAVLNSIIDASKSAVFKLKQEGKFELYNKTAMEMFGYEKRDLRKLSIADLLSVEELFSGNIERYLEENEGVFETMCTGTTKAGLKFPVRAQFNLVEKNGLNIITCFATDMRVEIREREELEQAYEEIKTQEEQLKASIVEMTKASQENQKKEAQLLEQINELKQKLNKK